MDVTSRTFVDERKRLKAMIGIYCRERHSSDGTLCVECAALLEYAEARLERCAFGEAKPKCSKCPIHCYSPAMRERIRDVMQVAGPRMMTRPTA